MKKSNWINRARQRAYQRKHCPELVAELTSTKITKCVQENKLKRVLEENDKLKTTINIKSQKIIRLEDALKRRNNQVEGLLDFIDNEEIKKTILG